MLNQDGDLGGDRKKKEETFSVQGLFLVSNFLKVIAFRSSLGSGEQQHIILTGAALYQKEIATQGGRQSRSGPGPAAVLCVVSGSCSLATWSFAIHGQGPGWYQEHPGWLFLWPFIWPL